MRIQGIHTAMITPFHENGDLDLTTYTALCKRQLDLGIHGLVACGTTGETPTLSLDEQEEVLRATLEVATGKVPVTMGVGTNNTRTTISRIERAAAVGADIGLLVFPYYNKPNPTGHLAHVEACCRVGLPVVLYHVPGRTGQRLDGALLRQLCEVSGVVAIKEATGDVAFAQALVHSVDIPVLSGDDFTMAALIAIGGQGVISVVSNVAPSQTTRLVQAAIDGDMAALQQMNRELQPLISYLFSDVNPAPTKAVMAELGLCKNELRLPLMPCAPPGRALLEGLQ